MLYYQIGTSILNAQESQGWGTKVIGQLSKHKNLQTALPTIEELEAELSKNLEGKNL